jgi:hypothetical protein
MRRVEIWNPLLHLDAAADRAWASAGSGERGDWRTDPGRQATWFRLAVLVAEATISRCLVEGAYLNARQLSVDLPQAATWLGDGFKAGPVGAGGVVVMVREGVWATVLEDQAAAVGAGFPQWAQAARSAAEQGQRPVADAGVVRELLDGFGRWAEDELDQAVSEASNLDGQGR